MSELTQAQAKLAKVIGKLSNDHPHLAYVGKNYTIADLRTDLQALLEDKS